MMVIGFGLLFRTHEFTDAWVYHVLDILRGKKVRVVANSQYLALVVIFLFLPSESSTRIFLSSSSSASTHI